MYSARTELSGLPVLYGLTFTIVLWYWLFCGPYLQMIKLRLAEDDDSVSCLLCDCKPGLYDPLTPALSYFIYLSSLVTFLENVFYFIFF